MAPITSARSRALSIISVMVVAVMLFLSSAVQATDQSPDTVEYRVMPGDTLWEIAREHGPMDGDIRRTVTVIERLNAIRGGQLQAGQIIEIPVLSS
ncbi:MAG: LysM peptidoglycan-binding domain-containing protein [Actinomycetota bacterium]|nr:LysM peptidoglycan-binding domain-containing protein [Actinomycetota bacterium]